MLWLDYLIISFAANASTCIHCSTLLLTISGPAAPSRCLRYESMSVCTGSQLAATLEEKWGDPPGMVPDWGEEETRAGNKSFECQAGSYLPQR